MATKLLREEDRRLDLTPNHGLLLPVRLRGSPHNEIGLVGEGLALLLPRRGEAIGQTTEIVIVVQVFRTGISSSPHVAVLGLELRGLRGGNQSEIVFGVLKIVLRGDRIAARVSVARQLKVSFSHMQRTATNSGVRAVRVIRTSSRGWVRDRDLFGGRDFGHSDQVTFLILRVQPLPLGGCRSFCGVAAFEASPRWAAQTGR